jgi:hypothetical protein
MSLLIEKSFTVLDAVQSGFVVPGGPAPQVSVEVIQRTPVEGGTIAITPLGSRRTMLLLSEIDNSVPFTCALTVDTSNMKLGDELFVSSRYLIYTGLTPISKVATIALPSNMILLRCGIFDYAILNQIEAEEFNSARKQQTLFTFDGDYLISTYDTV